MRDRTPTVLSLSRELSKSVVETVQQLRDCGYWDVASRKSKAYYDIPTGLLLLTVPQIRTEKTLSQHDTAHLLEYIENYGKRARQMSVSAETTKNATTALSQAMHYKEHVRDNSEESDFGSFGKETEFKKLLRLKQTIVQLNLKAMVAYTTMVTF